MVTKRTSGLPLICLICGGVARGINFDVMSCMSCKTFFRRHALKLDIDFDCQFENHCEITQQTRGYCSPCRLKKCFTLGMNSKLIGHRFQKSKIVNKKKNQLPQPLPLNLLQNDHSTLTINEWNLLSNIIHAYDEINIISHSKFLLEQQLSLLPKIRSKPLATFNIIKYFFSLFQPFIERTSFFHELSTETCQTLVRYNSQTFGTINAIFIMREVKALDYPAFLTGCNIIYGSETMNQFNKDTIRLEQNGIFIKIMLLILAFSTNCSIVSPDDSENITLRSNSSSIIHIENVLITMFWKYLVYQYGFLVAVRWFNSFIKYILDILQSSSERPNAQHSDMIEILLEETTRSLTIDD